MSLYGRRRRPAWVDIGTKYRAGDQPPADPNDYLGWHNWADAQAKGGLHQTQCSTCKRWRFPQELNAAGTCAGFGSTYACKPHG